MNTSVKVVLYTSKVLSNGESPIMLRLIKNRKPLYISTGMTCSRGLWDTKSNLPAKKHPHFKELKYIIAKKKIDAEKMIYDFEIGDKDLSVDEIRKKLTKEKSNDAYLFAFFDKIIDRFSQSGQIKNAEVYKDTKRNLIHFVGSKQPKFSEIDVAFLNKFEEHLKSKGKGANTIYIYLRTLRALVNKAIKEEIASEKYYGFKNFSLAKYSNIKTQKRAISKASLQQIANLDLDGGDMQLARDVFVFSYYCRGMNFTDIAFLKWKDIQPPRLKYTRRKTNEHFNILLLSPAETILNFYKQITFGSKESYVFPIFNEKHTTPQKLYNRKVKMLRQVNNHLKLISTMLKLDIELTTYVARHTYATVLKKEGISTTIISQALGHDSEKTTQIYLDSFENSVLDEASKSIL